MPIPLFKTKCYQILVSKPLRVRRRRTLKYEFTYWHGACMNFIKTRKNLTTLAKTNTWKSYKMSLLICLGNCRSLTNGRSTEILSSSIISGVRLLARIQNVTSFLNFIKLSVCWQRSHNNVSTRVL